MTEEMTNWKFLRTTAVDAVVHFVSNELWRAFEGEQNGMFRINGQLIYDSVRWSVAHYRYETDASEWTRDSITGVQAILRMCGIAMFKEEDCVDK